MSGLELLIEIGDGLVGSGQVGLINYDDGDDFRDAGFFPLELVAGLRLNDEDYGIGHAADGRVGLAGADRLYKDTVKAE